MCVKGCMCEDVWARKWTRTLLGGEWIFIKDYRVHFLGQGNNKRLTRWRSSVLNSLTSTDSAVMRNLLHISLVFILGVARIALKAVTISLWCPLSTSCWRNLAVIVSLRREARTRSAILLDNRLMRSVYRALHEHMKWYNTKYWNIWSNTSLDRWTISG